LLKFIEKTPKFSMNNFNTYCGYPHLSSLAKNLTNTAKASRKSPQVTPNGRK